MMVREGYKRMVRIFHLTQLSLALCFLSFFQSLPFANIHPIPCGLQYVVDEKSRVKGILTQVSEWPARGACHPP